MSKMAKARHYERACDCNGAAAISRYETTEAHDSGLMLKVSYPPKLVCEACDTPWKILPPGSGEPPPPKQKKWA